MDSCIFVLAYNPIVCYFVTQNYFSFGHGTSFMLVAWNMFFWHAPIHLCFEHFISVATRCPRLTYIFLPQPFFQCKKCAFCSAVVYCLLTVNFLFAFICIYWIGILACFYYISLESEISLDLASTLFANPLLHAICSSDELDSVFLQAFDVFGSWDFLSFRGKCPSCYFVLFETARIWEINFILTLFTWVWMVEALMILYNPKLKTIKNWKYETQ